MFTCKKLKEKLVFSFTFRFLTISSNFPFSREQINFLLLYLFVIYLFISSLVKLLAIYIQVSLPTCLLCLSLFIFQFLFSCINFIHKLYAFHRQR